MTFLNDNELEQYKHIMEMILHGDSERAKKMDKVTTHAIAGMKAILPDAKDEELAKVMMSIAYTMARLQSMPLAQAALFLQEAFEGYVGSVAVLAGAYVPDPDNIPDITKIHDDDDKNGYSDAEWENILGKAYL